MQLFGTDGIRGVVGEKLTKELAYNIGRAYGIAIRDEAKHKRILLGRDTRTSGEMLATAVSEGLNSVGFDVVSAGILPTPAHNYLSKTLAVDGGVMITASHNPPEHNGIKFCGIDGGKLPENLQQKIEDITLEIDKYKDITVARLGQAITDTRLPNLWVEYILSTLWHPDFSGIKVALDTANGAGYEVIPETFRRTGAEVLVFYNESTGKNINRDCGSTNVDKFAKICLKNNADIGFSFDGDADRIMVVAKDGRIIDGTDLMFIFGKYYAQNDKLVGNTVVSTIITNSGLESSLGALGINFVRTKVGGQYIQREMQEHGYVIGGEENGHLMLGDIGEGSDGMCVGLYLLKIMQKCKCDVLSLLEGLERAKIAKSDLHVTESQKSAVDNGALDSLTNELSGVLGDNGRIIVRTSGTETVVRVLVEGKDQDMLDAINKIIDYKIASLS